MNDYTAVKDPLEQDLARIETDWNAVYRLIGAMGMTDFLRVIARNERQTKELAARIDAKRKEIEAAMAGTGFSAAWSYEQHTSTPATTAWLLTPRHVSEWQPVETAPKNGPLIDIIITEADGSRVRWCDCYYDHICDQWRTSRPGGKLIWVPARAVTHWRHTPEFPDS